jgi:hypothetical protein
MVDDAVGLAVSVVGDHVAQPGVPMRAQMLAGSSQAIWKMVDPVGAAYFPDRYRHGLIVCIIVRETAGAAPADGPS